VPLFVSPRVARIGPFHFQARHHTSIFRFYWCISGYVVLGLEFVYGLPLLVRQLSDIYSKKVKFSPYSLPSIGPGADPGVQAVSQQVT